MATRSDEQDKIQCVLAKLQEWLLTEVSDELARPGKLKLTINLDESRQDLKVVAERFYNI